MGLVPGRDLQPLGQGFKPPTSTYLAQLEAQLQAVLPADYRKFLSSYGVCTCKDAAFLRLPGGLQVDLNVFYGSDPDDSYDILQIWRDLRGRLTDSLLPMACDAFGNTFCLQLAAPQGGVWYWDQETEEVHEVAKSFSAFLQLLQVDDLEMPAQT